MKQNMQSRMEQNFTSAQFSYIHIDHPTNESQGKLKGVLFLHASQGGFSGSSPLRSDGS